MKEVKGKGKEVVEEKKNEGSEGGEEEEEEEEEEEKEEEKEVKKGKGKGTATGKAITAKGSGSRQAPQVIITVLYPCYNNSVCNILY